eukprot:3558476-Prymnesium_polylepis.2
MAADGTIDGPSGPISWAEYKREQAGAQVEVTWPVGEAYLEEADDTFGLVACLSLIRLMHVCALFEAIGPLF